MAVIDHAVHEKVRIKADKPYSCNNLDRKFPIYHAPDRFAGTTGDQPIWWLRRKPIKHVMSRKCRYDMSLTDPRCGGCKQRGSGEKYDATVRAQGT